MFAKQTLRSEVVLEKYGKSLAGKIHLITGVSDISIAGEIAIQLSTTDPKPLILSGHTESKVIPVLENIKEIKPNARTRLLNMDLNDLRCIRKAVENDLANIPRIDHVICAARVMACPYAKTKDELEMQFGVNYLANFLLMKLLLPKVQAAGPLSSIISVTSAAVRQGKVHFEDIGFSVGKSTSQSPHIASSTLHSHILDEQNWTRLWELSEKLIQGK